MIKQAKTVSAKKGIAFFLTAFVLFFFYLLLSSSKELQKAASDALLFSAKVLIPALFPFAVLSRFLLLSSLLPQNGKIVTKIASLFSLEAKTLPAFVVGLFCGFPMGAYAASSLLEEGMINKEEAYRCASVANNASAAFLLISAGALFQNPICGKILFLSQTAASLLVGIFWARLVKKKAPPKTQNTAIKQHLTPPLMPLAADCIVKAGMAMLSVTAFVVFFSVVSKAVSLIRVLSPFSFAVTALLEATSAVANAAGLVGQIGMPLALALASFAVGFSGLSVLMQSQALFAGKLPLRPLLLCRTAIAILSALFALLLATALSL